MTTTPEADDAVAEVLASATGQPVTSFTNVETGKTAVSAYFDKRSDWSPARQAELIRDLKRIARSGLDLGPGQISFKRIPREDWAESWKLHFKPLTIGAALLLKPSWSQRLPQKGQALVVLDPGLSFGTGRHPTTAFCLRQLVAGRHPRKAQSCLDIGTGSGILAIVASKLGFAPVEAIDFDPQAVRVARANARRNGVSHRIRFRQQDLTRLPARSARKYSLVCANLISDLLLAERDRILARLHRDGMLVVAGILKVEFAQVERAFTAAGLRLVASRTGNEWRSGAFTWR